MTLKGSACAPKRNGGFVDFPEKSNYFIEKKGKNYELLCKDRL